MTFPTDPADPALEPAPEASTASGPKAPDPAAAATAEHGDTVRAAPASPRRRARSTVAIAIVAIVAGSTLFLSGWTLGRQVAITPGTPVTEAQLWQPFWDSYYAVTQRYAGAPVDRKTLVEGAIKGMVDALGDPFSQYLSPSDFTQSLQGISGQFSGIGTTVGTVDKKGDNTTCSPLSATCRLAIESTIPGSPAETAGLQSGDVITSVDGTPVKGQTVDQITQLIRGPKGTTVTLGIARGSSTLSVPIVRANILQPEVSTKSLADGKVAYIKLAAFSDQSSIDFAKAVRAAVDGGQKALIVDLRGNGGGFVTAARDIASQFLASGPVFYEKDASGNITEVAAEPGGAATDPSVKVVVLVDGGTASASEIVTGALHDRGRATVVGTKTYGKGTVQQWIQLENDSGGIRLTVDRWLTPDKQWIHKIGITPDVVVDQGPTKPGEDPVLDAGLKVLGFGGGSTTSTGSGSGG